MRTITHHGPNGKKQKGKPSNSKSLRTSLALSIHGIIIQLVLLKAENHASTPISQMRKVSVGKETG